MGLEPAVGKKRKHKENISSYLARRDCSPNFAWRTRNLVRGWLDTRKEKDRQHK